MILEPQIRPIREIDMQALIESAKNDNHEVIRPTHVVRKNDQIVGYMSIGCAPTVLLWMDTKKTNSRDSHAVMTFYENFVAAAGCVFVPVQKNSPYYPFMERLGYVPAGDGTIFMKGL